MLELGSVDFKGKQLQNHIQFQMREILLGKREETDIDTLYFKFKAVSMDTALLLCDRELNNHVACGSDFEQHMHTTFKK